MTSTKTEKVFKCLSKSILSRTLMELPLYLLRSG